MSPPRGLESLIGHAARRHRPMVRPRRPLPVPLPPSKLPTAAKLAVESTVVLSGLVLLTAWITQKVVQGMAGRKTRKKMGRVAGGFEEGLMAFESFNWGGL